MISRSMRIFLLGMLAVSESALSQHLSYENVKNASMAALIANQVLLQAGLADCAAADPGIKADADQTLLT